MGVRRHIGMGCFSVGHLASTHSPHHINSLPLPHTAYCTCSKPLLSEAGWVRSTFCHFWLNETPPPPQGLALIFIPAGGGDPSPLDPLPPSPLSSSAPENLGFGNIF